MFHQSQLEPENNKFHAGNGDDGKHYWLTPPAVYNVLDAEFSFDFDPCPFPLPAGFDGLTCEWGRSIYVRIDGWDASSAQPVAPANQSPTSSPAQTGSVGIGFNAEGADRIGSKNSLITAPDSGDQCLRNISYSQLDNSDAESAALSSHLIALILLLSHETDPGITHIAEGASQITQRPRWRRDAKILLREIRSALQSSNTENRRKDGRATGLEVLSAITSVGALLSDGLLASGGIASYTLETSAPIVDQKAFLVEIISSLYRTLIAQEPLPATWFPPAVHATARSIPSILTNGPAPTPPNGSELISTVYLRLNHRASVYCNPPFGSIIHQGKKKGPTAWARKAIAEAEQGKDVVLVYPIDKWVLMLLAAGAEVRNLGDVRWLATEDGSEGKGTGRHIAAFILKGRASA